MSAGGGRRQRFDAQEEIKRVILDRGLTAGCAIPTESELVAQLGISRGSLREALKGLQARGIIEVQHGRGMFVAHPSMDSLVDGLIFRGRLDGQRDDLTTAPNWSTGATSSNRPLCKRWRHAPTRPSSLRSTQPSSAWRTPRRPASRSRIRIAYFTSSSIQA